ncbi:hypothetical protein BDV96DRAFT_568952 [Lophiotrema nucula]|uniref:Uncharacterized protein n=1 Tax=Lophiotrema nucula TaxID=690887 RepID=A0A6A5ZHT6_9PLEO|nr:hypothetical protein BDV96DRAFT_568952 [Lophiotrema nucula]
MANLLGRDARSVPGLAPPAFSLREPMLPTIVTDTGIMAIPAVRVQDIQAYQASLSMVRTSLQQIRSAATGPAYQQVHFQAPSLAPPNATGTQSGNINTSLYYAQAMPLVYVGQAGLGGWYTFPIAQQIAILQHDISTLQIYRHLHLRSWSLVARDYRQPRSTEDNLSPRDPAIELLKIYDTDDYQEACDIYRTGMEKGWADEDMVEAIDRIKKRTPNQEKEDINSWGLAPLTPPN